MDTDQHQGESTTTVHIEADRETVFEVITNPGTYPDWLVGARAIRGVDVGWPAVGTSFRHLLGVPPLLILGSSTVLRIEPPEVFEIRAGMGPFGAAIVRFTLTGTMHGGTLVEVDERFVAGIVGLSWQFLRPVSSALVFGRNRTSLNSLRTRVEATVAARAAG